MSVTPESEKQREVQAGPTGTALSRGDTEAAPCGRSVWGEGHDWDAGWPDTAQGLVGLGTAVGGQSCQRTFPHAGQGARAGAPGCSRP